MNNRKKIADLPLIETRSVERLHFIHAGATGSVYKGESEYGTVAIKAITYSRPYEDEKAMLALVTALDIPNVIRCHGVIHESRSLVLEYMPKGALTDLLETDQAMPWSFHYDVILDVSIAVAHLHYHDILHRDIKPDNILLDESYRAKLADFDLATTVDEAKASQKVYGTPQWRLLSYPAGCNTKETDVYTLGLVTWCMFTRKIPGKKSRERYFHDVAKLRATSVVDPGLPTMFSVMAGVVKGALQDQPQDRPTADCIVGHLRLIDQREKRFNGP